MEQNSHFSDSPAIHAYSTNGFTVQNNLLRFNDTGTHIRSDYGQGVTISSNQCEKMVERLIATILLIKDKLLLHSLDTATNRTRKFYANHNDCMKDNMWH